jgi:hypothetical protein
MKALQAACLVGGITLTSTGIILLVGGDTPGAAVPDAMSEAAVSAETPAAPALSAAVPGASPGPGTALGAAPASVPAAVSGPSVMATAEIGDAAIETKSLDTKSADTKSADTKSADTKSADLGHQDADQTASITRGASDDVSDAAPATQNFRYLIYYVWSELPPAEKPADVVLNSLKHIPAGTTAEEIKRAADAFGLDFNYMKAVAKVESGFDPKQRTGSYLGLFQLSRYEFSKFGSGKILDPRDNAVAAAYKIITEGILFEWVTHKKPTLSDLYLIHQQGWEGAAQHISHPDRIAWKSMCATSEGVEKGERWCKRAIWRNTLPDVKHAWKSVDKLTSAAFVGMWRERIANLYSKYTATAAAEPAKP